MHVVPELDPMHSATMQSGCSQKLVVVWSKLN
ncbi:hypothetical protein A2U01_0085973, partial [Trifolium medium]|nr:hypothetical protein [Trifolium medium]